MSKYFSWDVTHFLPSAGAEFVNKLLDGTLADEASGVEPDSAERRAELSALTAERTTIDFKPLAPGARPDERTGESVISWTSQQNGQAKALGPTVEVTFEKPQRVWTLELEKTDDEKSQQFYVRIENEIDGHWPNTVPRSHCALGKRTKFVLPESVPARHWRITTVGPDGSLPDVHHWVTQLTFRSTPGQ
jgi:hypothetical protein